MSRPRFDGDLCETLDREDLAARPKLPVSEEESDELHERWSIPARGKPLVQAATANLTPHSEDAVIELVGLENRGHSLVIDSGWSGDRMQRARRNRSTG